MVNVSLANAVANTVSARVAGLCSTAPLVLNRDPWHGQMNVVPDTLLTVQPSWVQTAVRAENACSEMRATRKFPMLDCTSAVPPTAASAEPAATGTVTARPETAPVTVGSAEPFPPLDTLGDVGLPPLLHPGSTAPTATSDIA